MKKKWIFGLSFLILSFPFQSCESKTVDNEGQCIRVRILAYICAEAVFQILDPAYYHLGELNWASGEAKYDHVFHSFLGCPDIDYLGTLPSPFPVGKEMDVQLTSGNLDNNCAVCKATLGNVPKTKLSIKFKLNGCK